MKNRYQDNLLGDNAVSRTRSNAKIFELTSKFQTTKSHFSALPDIFSPPKKPVNKMNHMSKESASLISQIKNYREKEVQMLKNKDFSKTCYKSSAKINTERGGERDVFFNVLHDKDSSNKLIGFKNN